MAYKKYQLLNTLYSKGISSILSSDLTILCTVGEEAMFVNSTNGYPLILEEFNGSGVCTKREIVKFVSRTSNILTITRAFESCIQDDSASIKTSTQNALSFSSGFKISLYMTNEIVKDIQDEVARIETEKLNIIDQQKQTKVYGISTGSANAYVLTITPAITSYLDGMKFCFKSNFANTGACTVNINGLGAKTIKKLGGSADLSSGDIKSGQDIEIVYDETYFQMTSPIGQLLAIDTPQTITTFVAGEAITAGQPLYVSNGAGARTVGRVYKASSLYTTYSDMGQFIGFSVEAQATPGNNIRVNTDGININQTGLTIGAIYYLTDTAGTIGTTPGTNPVRVGIATTTTAIKIRERNKVIGVTAQRDVSLASGTVTYNHNLGTIPKAIIAQSVTSFSGGSGITMSNGVFDGKTNYNTYGCNNAYSAANSSTWSIFGCTGTV